jgi:hypothetical protein
MEQELEKLTSPMPGIIKAVSLQNHVHTVLGNNPVIPAILS